MLRAGYEAPDPQWAAPANYYSTATATDAATLTKQLHAIISSGFVARSYGDERYAMQLLFRDPNNPNNIILTYTDTSVPGAWDGGTTYNREHMWPEKWLNISVTDSYVGVGSDLFELAPTNPNVNSARSDEPYGTASNSGGYVDNKDTWFPGDKDKGDVARSLFYMAVRYDGEGGTQKLTLVNGTALQTFQMGDLNSLLHWNYEDGVDNFERRKNEMIYSSALNPTYYQGNRNPFIDHPEYVWAIFGGGVNNSKLYLGSTPPADGTSSATVALGRVMRTGGATSSVTLNKTGVDPTTYDITTTGAAATSTAGVGQAIDYNAQTRSIDVGIVSTTADGLATGTIVINNTDLTTDGAGMGSQDGNDTINVSATVLDKRVVTASGPVAIGRVMVGNAISKAIALSTSGDDNSRTEVTVAGTSAGDGIGLGISGTANSFKAANDTGSRTVSGAFTTAGAKSGNLSLAVTTAENGGLGLTGEGAYTPITVGYTAAALTQRIVNAPTVALGQVIVGGTVSGAVSLATSGDDNSRTEVTVAGTASPDLNGASISGTASTFASATATGTRTLSGTFTTSGSQSGSLALAVHTAENNGLGLAGEGSYASIGVGYTATVLDHAIPSFNAFSLVQVATLNFGTLTATGTPKTLQFFLANLASSTGAAFTAGLDLDSHTESGNTSDFNLVLSPVTDMAAGSEQLMAVQMDTDTTGSFQAVYQLLLSDERLPGANAPSSDVLKLTVKGTIVSAPEPAGGTVLVVLLALACLRRSRRSATLAILIQP